MCCEKWIKYKSTWFVSDNGTDGNFFHIRPDRFLTVRSGCQLDICCEWTFIIGLSLSTVGMVSTEDLDIFYKIEKRKQYTEMAF